MQKKYTLYWSIEAFVVFVLSIGYMLTKNTVFAKCVLNEYFNILCPTCGGTRCVMSFIKFNWKDSFFYNPIIFFTLIYLIILNIVFLINYISKKDRFKFLFPNEVKFVIYACVLVIYGIVRNIL